MYQAEKCKGFCIFQTFSWSLHTRISKEILKANDNQLTQIKNYITMLQIILTKIELSLPLRERESTHIVKTTWRTKRLNFSVKRKTLTLVDVELLQEEWKILAERSIPRFDLALFLDLYFVPCGQELMQTTMLFNMIRLSPFRTARIYARWTILVTWRP